MKQHQDKYPHFEANQVLTNTHLNQVFDYLDEQERLTRANLIGIGIVCGLEFRIENTGGNTIIHVTKGCGVGSAGYLLNEPENISLVSYREYTLPNELEYPRFTYDDAGVMKQYPLWELFPDGEPNTPLLNSPAGFLNDKVLMLFLELKLDGLRNCSPNDCNDKGEEVTATLKHLLVRTSDLQQIIAAAGNVQGNLTLADLGQLLSGRINLPDIKIPGWDVPNTSPVTTYDVLKGFHSVFTNDGIVTATANALSAAYLAFRPLLLSAYPTDPFAGFPAQYGFLENASVPADHLKFMQYYYGFFEDLLNAYDEFRWKGAGLMCACCPPEDLFPRHLMLGILNPASVNNPEIFRNHFIQSPAISNCEEQTREVQQLFARLVEMTVQFTRTPPLFQSGDNKTPASILRITPDTLGNVDLSEKAIPYYYLQSGSPQLFMLWNFMRTRTGRANQNQGYSADAYNPAAPPFILRPLRYDLEPYNFLRIEGHLGLNYQAVLRRILALKRQYRLPIDVIALRTGEFDEQSLVEPGNQSCNFSDLEAQYDSRISELIGFLGSNLRYFYDLYYPQAKGLLNNPVPSQVQWFAAYDPDFRVKPNTLGAYFEVQVLPGLSSHPYYNPNNPALNIIQFIGGTAEPLKEFIIFYVIYYIVRFPEILSQDLSNLDLEVLVQREKDITSVAEAVEIKREQLFANNQQEEGVTSWEDLDDRLEALVYGHYSDSIKALIREYQRRLKELTKKLYLSHYLTNNPGIRHKAGVTMGGTFILVYHGEERIDQNHLKPQFGNFTIRGQVVIDKFQPMPGVTILIKGTSKGVITDFSGNFFIVTSELPVTLRIATAGFRTLERRITREGFFLLDLLDDITEDEAGIPSDFFAGEVIADFYLPYLCNSDCSPVQFTLPVVPPSLGIETGCTDASGNARIILSPMGGTAPYKLKINNGDFVSFDEAITVNPGEYTLVIRDAEGIVSPPQTITIPANLVLGEPNFDCTGDNNQYVAAIEISGGSPPYSANTGRILNGTTFFGEGLPGDTDIEIIITDSRKCSAAVTLNHSCGPELSFIARIGCANADNFSQVEIIASGGQAPYEVQVGTEPFGSTANPLSLPAGPHTLVVRDTAGSLTAPQELVIPGQILHSRPEFNCIGNNNEYIVQFRLTGGLPPYTASQGRFERNNYTSDPFPGNTNVVVVISDSRKCTVSVPLIHSCLGDLAFSVNIGCTSANGAALVEITPSGGFAPYEIQADTQAFVPLTGPISLPFGNHQITLRDAFSSIASQTINIPEALTLQVIKLSCERDNANYSALIRINGGTPPFIAMGSSITGNEFVTDLIPSSQQASFEVIDHKKCRTSIEVQHSCDEPCNLPCEGETMQCVYRLWIQPPSKTEFYELYRTLKKINFRFNGKQYNLENALDLLQIPIDQLNQDFNDAIAAAIKRLNEAINKVLTADLGDIGTNRLSISYKPLQTDPFAVFRIEHFVCDSFNIEFNYTYGRPNPTFGLNVSYTNETSDTGLPFNGAVFSNLELDGKQTIVPAFDCGKRNLCSGSDFEKLCSENNLKPDFNIEPISRIAFLLKNTSTGTGQVAWVWDLTGVAATEPFYEGVEVQVVAKPTGNVRLTVISNKGCFAFTDKELKR